MKNKKIDKLNAQISSFNSFKKEDIQTEEKLLQEIYKNLENGIKIEQERIISLNTRFGELEAERLVIQNGSSFSKRSKLEKLAEQQAGEREEIKNKTREANAKIDSLRAIADSEIKKLRDKIDNLRQQSSSQPTRLTSALLFVGRILTSLAFHPHRSR